MDPQQYVFLFANIKWIPLGGDRFCWLELLTTFKANIALNKLKQFELCRLFICETVIVEKAFKSGAFCLQEFWSSPSFLVSRWPNSSSNFWSSCQFIISATGYKPADWCQSHNKEWQSWTRVPWETKEGGSNTIVKPVQKATRSLATVLPLFIALFILQLLFIFFPRYLHVALFSVFLFVYLGFFNVV